MEKVFIGGNQYNILLDNSIMVKNLKDGWLMDQRHIMEVI